MDNKAADYLSRMVTGNIEKENENKLIVAKTNKKCNKEKQLITLIKNLANLKKNDKKAKNVYDQLKIGKKIKNYILKNDIILHKTKNYNKWRALIPHNIKNDNKYCFYVSSKILSFTYFFIKNDIIDLMHAEIGHSGIYKTTQFINKNLYWKGQKRDIRKRIKTCDICQRTKHLNIAMEEAYQAIIPENPNELIAVVFYGPLPVSRSGTKYIFVIKDVFSKLITLYPIKAANTKTCLKKLINNYFRKNRKPKCVLSDHGKQFSSPKGKETLYRCGVKVSFSSIRHPQSNPAERTMRELGRFFSTYCSTNHANWGNYTEKIENWLNVITNESTGLSSYEVHFGKNPKDKIAEILEIVDEHPIPREICLKNVRKRLKMKAKMRANQQKTISKVELKIGNLVLLKIPHISRAENKEVHKYFHIFFGPCRRKDIIKENAFKLVEMDDERKVKGTYNRVHLRRYYPRNE